MTAGVAHSIGRTWFILFGITIGLIQFAAYMSTTEGDSDLKDDSRNLYVWLLFASVIAANVLMLIPYTLSITKRRHTSGIGGHHHHHNNSGGGSLLVSTGVNKYVGTSHISAR
jgi:hypothetical protein